MILQDLTNNLKFLILSFGMLLCAGCQNPSDKWRPEVPFRTQILVSHSEGSELREVELEGVRDRKTLKGEIVQFLYAPGETGQRVKGVAPVARFVEDSRGVFIPADSVSLQMTTLYYHLQEMRKLELKAHSKALISWPRKVGIRVESTSPKLKFNNAFYNSKYDMLFFVPYNGPDTPVALNGGVIAHELFHAYFAEVVSKLNEIVGAEKPRNSSDKSTREEDAYDQLYIEYILKSLNEGLADLWGWLYTGDADFIMASLPNFGHGRSLQQPAQHKQKLKTKSQIENTISTFSMYPLCRDNPSQCTTEDSYVNGSILARTLRAFALTYKSQHKVASEDLQLEMAQRIFQLLKALRRNLENGTLDLESTVVLWSQLFDKLSLSECDILKDVLSTSEESKKICAP